LPSLTPTMTPQPVPQKRQGALSHLISSALTPPGTGWAAAGSAMPAAAAATPAACAFRMSRRVSSLPIGLVLFRIDLFENHVGGDHAVDEGDAHERIAEYAGARPFDHHDDLALVRAVHLDILEARKGRKDAVETAGLGGDHRARNVMAPRLRHGRPPHSAARLRPR